MTAADMIIFGRKVSGCASSTLPRDLDAVEFFSGVRSIQRACVRRGLRAEFLDKLHGGTRSDVTAREGFNQGVDLALRIKWGGLMTVAPLCASFSSPCASVHRRSPENDFFGDMTKHCVIEGNDIADVAAFYAVLGATRGVRVVFENPPKSKMWDYSPVKHALAFIGCTWQADVRRCAYDVGSGPLIGKSFRFKSTENWIKVLERPCVCTRPHVKLTKEFIQSNTGKAKNVGQRRWTGIKSKLEESGSYPNALGECMVGLWRGEDMDVLFTARRNPLPALPPKPHRCISSKAAARASRASREVEQKRKQAAASGSKSKPPPPARIFKKPAARATTSDSTTMISWMSPSASASDSLATPSSRGTWSTVLPEQRQADAVADNAPVPSWLNPAP